MRSGRRRAATAAAEASCASNEARCVGDLIVTGRADWAGRVASAASDAIPPISWIRTVSPFAHLHVERSRKMTATVSGPHHVDGAGTPSAPWLPDESWARRVHYGSLALGFLLITGLLRGTWFRGDDFEFLSNRVGDVRLLNVWVPHNEHWSTGPILVWQGLYELFGVNSALPYLACAVLSHVLVAHFLWRLMNRAGARPWVSTGLAAVFLFLGAGFENITWAFQLGFMGSVALGLAALLLCLRDGRAPTIGAVVCSVVALTFAGIGLPFAVSAALCLVLRRQIRRAVVLAAVTGTAYVVWYLTAGHLAGPAPHSSSQLDRLSNAPRWAWGLLSSAMEALASMPGAGPVLALAVTVWIGFRFRTALTTASARDTRTSLVPQEWVVVLPLLANLVFQATSLAVFRSDISPPASSRYLYFVIALLLPFLALLLSEVSRRTHPLVALVVVAYLVLTQGVYLVAAERQFESPQLLSDVRGLAWLVDHRKPITDVIAPYPYINDQAIRKWLAEDALHVAEDLPAQMILDGSVVGQVTFAATAESAAVGKVEVDGQTLGLIPGACADASVPPGSEAALMTLSPGQTVSITLDQPGNFTVQVVDGERSSRPRTVAATPNQPQWLGVTSPLTVRVAPEAGQDITFCNPGPTTTR
jgi:hypothetical protein